MLSPSQCQRSIFSAVSLAPHSDGEGFDRSYDRYVVRRIRSDGKMLARLERSSELYLLGPRRELEDPFDEICAKCEALVSSPDADAFDEELERLVREEGLSLLHGLLSQVASRSRRADEGESQWPLVELALVEALGDDAADRFRDGLQLLSWRNLLSRQYDGLVQDRRTVESPPVTIPDPEIWSLSFSAVAADICFVAVSTLLGQRRTVEQWIGAQLAETFYRGQQDSVRLLASMLSPMTTEHDLISKAIGFAGVALIDFNERYRQAEATQGAAQSIVESHGGVGLITPFATVEEGDEEDYPDDDPDEWIPITESGKP